MRQKMIGEEKKSERNQRKAIERETEGQRKREKVNVKEKGHFQPPLILAKYEEKIHYFAPMEKDPFAIDRICSWNGTPLV